MKITEVLIKNFRSFDEYGASIVVGEMASFVWKEQFREMQHFASSSVILGVCSYIGRLLLWRNRSHDKCFRIFCRCSG